MRPGTTTLLAVVLSVPFAAACGGQPDRGAGVAAPVDTELTVTVRASPEGKPTAWTLRCEPAGGDHPDPAAACAALAAAEAPFDPVPADVVCTEIYGGPETATVSGRYGGAAVAASYARTNGCEIGRWEAIAPVLGPIAGAAAGPDAAPQPGVSG